MFAVAVIGSANLDLVATTLRLPGPGETVLGTSFREHPGGKGLNQAVAAARDGATVAFVGALGRDDAGRVLFEVATSEGIDTGATEFVTQHPTGRAVITVDTHGENSIVVIPGANATVGGSGLPPSTVVLAQLEVPVAAVTAAFTRARAAGRRTLLNPAPVPEHGLPDELLALSDIVIPNEHELSLLGGLDALLRRGVGTVVVTRGAAGVSVDDATGSWHVEASRVDPIDTTGAGDAFCGALASRLAAGDTMETAVRHAAAAGALATTVAGAVPSLPRHAAIIELLAASDAGAPPGSVT